MSYALNYHADRGLTVEEARKAIPDDLTHVVVIGQTLNGSLKIIGSHRAAESLLLMAQAQSIIVGNSQNL